jgi:hypothetical protein
MLDLVGGFPWFLHFLGVYQVWIPLDLFNKRFSILIKSFDIHHAA